MRRNAREAVFTLLYRDLFLSEKDEGFVKKIYAENSLTPEDEKFADELYATVKNNEDEIASVISSFSSGFNFSRLFPTDKCALKIGVAELRYFDDVPEIVAIDEAVFLSRKFSAEKSPSFVNGILAAYKKSLDESRAVRGGKSSVLNTDNLKNDGSAGKNCEDCADKQSEKCESCSVKNEADVIDGATVGVLSEGENK